MQNARNRQAKNEFQNEDVIKDELLTKSVKAVTEDMESKETETKRMLEINYTRKVTSNSNTLKMETGKPFGITKIRARIILIITVGGHEVTRNLSEYFDQTLIQKYVFGDYLRSFSPQTPSKTIKALVTRGDEIDR